MPIRVAAPDTYELVSTGITWKGSDPHTPKFFGQKLEHHHVWLSSEHDPIRATPQIPANVDFLNMQRESVRIANKIIYTTPFFLLPYSAWNYIREWPVIDKERLRHIGTRGDVQITLAMRIHSMHRTQTQLQDEKDQRTFMACYQYIVYFSQGEPKGMARAMANVAQAVDSAAHGQTAFITVTTCEPIKAFSVLDEKLKQAGVDTGDDLVTKALESYKIYDMVTWQTHVWQEHAAEEFLAFVKNIVDSRAINSFQPEDWNALLFHLEDYAIPIGQYEKMHAGMSQILSQRQLYELCQKNINLLLYDTIALIKRNKDYLHRLPTNRQLPSITTTPEGYPYSNEQRTAIETTEPLVIVQAGAGTGKSSVILARIRFLLSAGVPANDVTVLSFTNAAADHISNESTRMTTPQISYAGQLATSVQTAPQQTMPAPYAPMQAVQQPTPTPYAPVQAMQPQTPNIIKSMTIASMVNRIYMENHPNHRLVPAETLTNAMRSTFGRTNGMIEQFAQLLLKMRWDQHLANWSKLHAFIDANLADVLTALDTVRMVTLELQILICEICVDQLREPPDLLSKFVIVDETQDNSMFEFVFLQRYVMKHKSSLFIVGDASQTLYEFRSANPKALNALENSGLFACYQLQINFRSNRSITDFANTLLETVDANQYAQIRLRSNMVEEPDPDLFGQRVRVTYVKLKGSCRNGYEPLIEKFVECGGMAYIYECLTRQEQVLVLGRTNDEVDAIQKEVEWRLGARATTARLGNRQRGDICIVSRYVENKWDDLVASVTQHLNAIDRLDEIIANDLVREAPSLYRRGKQKDHIDTCLSFANDWLKSVHSYSVQWRMAFMNGAMTIYQLLNLYKESLFDFEVRRNEMNSRMKLMANKDDSSVKLALAANVKFSTVHSAKGLECENVLILWNTTRDDTLNEENKRLYYVALSRARKTELIFAYGTAMMEPTIKKQHRTVIDQLTVLKKQHDRAMADAQTEGDEP
jgi:superfamily I DNA/RNA helicase